MGNSRKKKHKVKLEYCMVPERKEGLKEYLDMTKEQKNHLKMTHCQNVKQFE